MKKLIMLFVGMAFIVSCNNGGNPEKIDNDSIMGNTHQNESLMPAMTNKKAVVLEAIDGGTYTYLRLQGEGKEFWAAITTRPVVTGQSYYYTESIVMRDFESKQLQRTFDSILFIEYFGENPKNTGDVSLPSTAGDHASASRKENIAVELSPDEISLEELFGNKEDYKGKKIRVKGEVVKISRNIMDRNWIHIQDGTSYEGQYDLTLTLIGAVGFDLNSIVTFRGTVTLDKDFGAGYFYPVIIEDAEIVAN